MYCSECGKEIPEESEFCPYCGTKLKDKQYEPKKYAKQKTEEIKMKEDKKMEKFEDICIIIDLILVISLIIIVFNLK